MRMATVANLFCTMIFLIFALGISLVGMFVLSPPGSKDSEIDSRQTTSDSGETVISVEDSESDSESDSERGTEPDQPSTLGKWTPTIVATVLCCGGLYFVYSFSDELGLTDSTLGLDNLSGRVSDFWEDLDDRYFTPASEYMPSMDTLNAKMSSMTGSFARSFAAFSFAVEKHASNAWEDLKNRFTYGDLTDAQKQLLARKRIVSHAAECVNPLGLKASFLELNEDAQNGMLKKVFRTTSKATHPDKCVRYGYGDKATCLKASECIDGQRQYIKAYLPVSTAFTEILETHVDELRTCLKNNEACPTPEPPSTYLENLFAPADEFLDNLFAPVDEYLFGPLSDWMSEAWNNISTYFE